MLFSGGVPGSVGRAHKDRLVRARPSSKSYTGPIPTDERVLRNLGAPVGKGRLLKFDVVRRRGAFTRYYKTVLCADEDQSALYYCKIDGYGALAPPARLIPLRQIVGCEQCKSKPERFEIKIWVVHFENYSSKSRNNFYTFRFSACSEVQAAEWVNAVNLVMKAGQSKLDVADKGRYRGPRSSADAQLMFSVQMPETSDPQGKQAPIVSNVLNCSAVAAPPPSLTIQSMAASSSAPAVLGASSRSQQPPPPPRRNSSLGRPKVAEPAIQYSAQPSSAFAKKSSFSAAQPLSLQPSLQPPARPRKPSKYSPETYNPQPMMFHGFQQEMASLRQSVASSVEPKNTLDQNHQARQQQKLSPPPVLPRKESIVSSSKSGAGRSVQMATAAGPCPPPRPQARPAHSAIHYERKADDPPQTIPRTSGLVKAPLQATWKVASSPEGAPYWYNENGETTWTMPTPPPPPARRPSATSL